MEWEEAEKILSWREMQPGVYTYHGIEHRGTNDYGRPISVVTLEDVKRFYAKAAVGNKVFFRKKFFYLLK